MSNVHPFVVSNADRAIGFVDDELDSILKPRTASELKRTIAGLKRAIAKENKRRLLQDEMVRLVIQLHDMTERSKF